ncbi:MAG: response regulator [Polyangiaceae bacterium]|nr:response regulator [Polyangiaceae bacterium]
MTTTVLAVDDSKTIRRVLEITFAGEEFRTLLADSAGDALSKLGRENPHIAVVDAILGAESGYDLCQQIKERSPHLPVVILSSKQHPFDRARGASVGADDFMDKPFDTQQLIDKVTAVLRKAAMTPADRGTPAPAHLERPAAAPAAAPVVQRAPAPAPRPASPAAAPVGAGVGRLGQPAPFATAARPAPGPGAAGGPVTRPGIGLGGMGGRPAQPSPAAQPRAAAPVVVGTGRAAGAGAPAAAPQPTPAQQPPAPRPGSAPQASPGPVAPRSPAAPTPPAATPLAAAAVGVPAVVLPEGLPAKLEQLGLSADQVKGVLAISREVVEAVVWEVVPVLAETLIREEIRRLTAE